MLRVLSDGLWPEIKKLGRKKLKFAAIAYVTSDRDLKFGRRDVLICDASDAAIQSGQTSAAVLRAAVRRGAAVYSSPGLHAKAMVLGRVAVVGSGNMSDASASQLVEAAIITDDARAVAGVRVLVHQLVDGADRVDDAFLKRISKLTVRAPRRGSRRRRAVTVRGPRAWFISVAPLNEDRYEHENDLVEAERRAAERSREYSDSDAGYIRWAGNSRFYRDAKPGDLVVTAWKPSHKSKRGTVYAPEPLLRRKKVGKVTHFFVEEYADREDTAIPFARFRSIWTRLGGSESLSVSSTREIPVELLETARQMWVEKRT